MSVKAKERLKSVLLLFEFFLMMALLVLTWQYAKGDAGMGQGFFRGLFGGPGIPAAPEEITPVAAAYPLSAAAGFDGGLYGAAWDLPAVGALYDRVKPVLAEALGSAGAPQAATEEEYAAALKGNMAFFGFDGKIPLFALCAWLGATPPETLSAAGQAERIVLAAGQDTISLYYREEKSGAPMRMQTAARSRTLEPILMETKPNGAFFAMDGGKEFAALSYDTLLTGKPLYAAKLNAVTPLVQTGSEAALAIFDAFQFNPYTVRKYPENDGTQVYVEDLATLRVSPGGLLVYSLPEGKDADGVAAPGVAAARDKTERQLLLIEAARSFVGKVYGGVGTGGVYLYAFTYDENTGRSVAIFGCEAGGIPVTVEDGAFAALEFQGNRLLSARMHLRRYEPTEEKMALLPERQAAAAVSGKTGVRMTPRYMDAGGDTMSAGWYY